MKTIWTPSALRDIEAIGDYIAGENPVAAARVVTRIFEQVDLLDRSPEIGRAGRVVGTRELVVSRTPYIVAYRAIPAVVQILAVIHGARKWPDRF
jgi:toxin ParE1/3/4